MAKRLKEFVRELMRDFSLKNFLLNRMTDSDDVPEERVSCYRPISGRGRDQWRCLLAHIRTWQKTGRTWGYCSACSQYLAMTCMEASGYSDECRRGHYRLEAT